MTGTITALQTAGTAGGYGVIASDAHGMPWELRFRDTAVIANGFARLRAGQRVRFDQELMPGNPGRWHAVQIAPLP